MEAIFVAGDVSCNMVDVSSFDSQLMDRFAQVKQKSEAVCERRREWGVALDLSEEEGAERAESTIPSLLFWPFACG